VPAQPLDSTMLHTSGRQHTAAADKLAMQIANCANAVRKQLALGQPAGPAARQIGSDILELMAELGALREDGRFATWTRQPAA
jgi:hypothetical protein